jgi:putative Ca2+/H+ antiporter (TMEM165/GDT1 family)
VSDPETAHQGTQSALSLATLWAGFAPVFITVFLAELGDKTQLAAALFATDGSRPVWLVFVAASLALVASTAIAVAAGSMARGMLTRLPLELIAGVGFIAIGAYMVAKSVKLI